MTHVRFKVLGRPEPAGSKRFVGRVIDANPNAKAWQHEVAIVALGAMRGEGLLDGPLGLITIFTLRRPKGHFGKGRNADVLKPNAPLFPTTRPDSTKLLRGVEDALTGVVWHDDGQVVEQMVSKRYGDPQGVEVTVWTL